MNEHSDFILTRILWLDGLDPGNANTQERYIYIHGTNRTDSPRNHRTPTAAFAFPRRTC